MVKNMNPHGVFFKGNFTLISIIIITEQSQNQNRSLKWGKLKASFCLVNSFVSQILPQCFSSDSSPSPGLQFPAQTLLRDRTKTGLCAIEFWVPPGLGKHHPFPACPRYDFFLFSAAKFNPKTASETLDLSTSLSTEFASCKSPVQGKGQALHVFLTTNPGPYVALELLPRIKCHCCTKPTLLGQVLGRLLLLYFVILKYTRPREGITAVATHWLMFRKTIVYPLLRARADAGGSEIRISVSKTTLL